MSTTTPYILRPPRRETLTESITESLREAIFAGVFLPGQRIAEAQLAKRLEVSRAPIREALALLEQEGLVSRTSAGTVISQLSQADVVEICTLRHALEMLATRLALSQPDSSWCDALAENIQQTKEDDDPRNLARLDLEFHEIIVRAARHNRLLSSWLKLRSQIRLMMMHRNLADSQSHEGTVRTHEAMLTAFRAKDVARTVDLLEGQMQAKYDWIVHTFDASSGSSKSADLQ